MPRTSLSFSSGLHPSANYCPLLAQLTVLVPMARMQAGLFHNVLLCLLTQCKKFHQSAAIFEPFSLGYANPFCGLARGLARRQQVRQQGCR